MKKIKQHQPASTLEDKVSAALNGQKIPETIKTVFRIPKEDEAIILKLKKYLNKDQYTLRVRFRGKRSTPIAAGLGVPEGSIYVHHGHTRKVDADWFAVYIEEK